MVMENATAAPSFASEEAKKMSDFATLLSFALNVTEDGTYQPLGISAPDKLVALMASDGSTCTFPSLQLHRRKHEEHSSCTNTTKAVLADAAASNLRATLTLNATEVETIPLTLLWNLSKSLLSMADSRLRSTVQALQARSSSSARSKLVLELLQERNPIQLGTIVTSFRALDCSHHVAQQGQQRIPLLFEGVIDLQVLGQMVTIQLQAPGTIQGSYVAEAHGFDSVEVVLDTNALLKCMIQETKRLIRRTVSLATQVAACVTQTLPRNAPQDLMELRERLLQQRAGLSPAILEKELGRQQAPAPLPLPLEPTIDSTKALEECFSMPPPPSRFSTLASCGENNPKVPGLASVACQQDNRKRQRSDEEERGTNKLRGQEES